MAEVTESTGSKPRVQRKTVVSLVIAVCALAIIIGVTAGILAGNKGDSSTNNNKSVGLDEAQNAPPSVGTVPITDSPTSASQLSPTLVPSSAPSIRSSTAPTAVGTLEPTTTVKPTVAPTAQASSVPSLEPTVIQSSAPTSPPATNSPTSTVVDPNLRFRLKMHWEKEFMWQDEGACISKLCCCSCVFHQNGL